MIPTYKCSNCNKVFVEWVVENEWGTPWHFIKRVLSLETNRPYLRGTLICPNCGSNEGVVVWLSRNPHIVFNHGVKAQILGVHSLSIDEASDPAKVREKVKELFPEEDVVVWTEEKFVEIVLEGKKAKSEDTADA